MSHLEPCIRSIQITSFFKMKKPLIPGILNDNLCVVKYFGLYPFRMSNRAGTD